MSEGSEAQNGMRVGIEATSLLDARSSVGRSTACVVDALVSIDEGVRVALFPLNVRRGGRARYAVAGDPRIEVVRSRLPERVARSIWSHVDWPPAELFCGALDVYWAAESILPPLVKAAGIFSVHDLAYVHVPETCTHDALALAEIVPQMVRRANRVVVPSRFVAQELAEWIPDEAARIRVVYPGVRRVFRERGGHLTAPRREALGIREPYVVYVGSLHVRRDLDKVLSSFELVRATHPDAQLVLVGSPGVGWDAIRARYAKLFSTDAVRVLGYLPDPEVAAIVRGANVFVYLSRYEGFGIPPLEAMVAGTPVVAAKTSALPEALGDHARWVHPDDVDDVASAIGDHFEGADDASVEAAREWAAEFTWARTAASMLEVFGEAMREVAA